MRRAKLRRATNLVALLAAIALVIVALSIPGLVRAADPDRPHPHRGILTGYEDVPEIELDENQLARLARGELVTMTIEDDDGGGRGLAVIDIAAPPEVVWSRILSFERYPDWVGPVKECEILADRGDTVYTRTKISGFLYSYEYFLVNVFHPDRQILTWGLDYDRYSDFDDCVGGWAVEPHPEHEGWSRGWFGSDLELRDKLPGVVMNEVRKTGLRDATAWVKREAEKAAATPGDR